MNILILYNTIIHLRFKQVYYRLYYFARGKLFRKSYSIGHLPSTNRILFACSFSYQDSYLYKNKFELLNKHYQFDNRIDWNFSDYGKLWTYNLNYFDFLNQEDDLGKVEGLALITDYIEQKDTLKDGLEPYPISLRAINWVKFLSRHDINDSKVNGVLFAHLERLTKNLEYHILANHLLENGFGLLFGAYYFKNEKWYCKATSILKSELKEQFLADGGHYERSPMYHQILLHRCLDLINLISNNSWKKDDLLEYVIGKTSTMLSWLDNVTYPNGQIPMVNDAAYYIAPSSRQLTDYAQKLGVLWQPTVLGESGYRKLKWDNFELFVDVGEIGPSYQPGHAHSDTFSFELYYNNAPLIVDTGTSTYEKNKLRQYERATRAHNTVCWHGKEQSQVWGGFRVAKRAKICELKESTSSIKATHDGYAPACYHTRKFERIENGIRLLDELSELSNSAEAYFHWHPDIEKMEINGTQIILENEGIVLNFRTNDIKINKDNSHIAAGFNKCKPALMLTVQFRGRLETTIEKMIT